jgi:hypothetical protein
LNQTLPLQLDHDVVSRWHWCSNKLRGNRAHGLWLTFLFLWFLLLNRFFFFWIVNLFTIFVNYLFLLHNYDWLRFGRRRLKWCKRFLVGVYVEKCEQAIRMISCRPNIHMTLHAPCCKILVFKFA